MAALSTIEGGRFRGKKEKEAKMKKRSKWKRWVTKEKKIAATERTIWGGEATTEERMKGQQAVTKENNR